MTKIRFETQPYKIAEWTILHLPKGESGSHWFRVSANLQKAANTAQGDTVTLEIEPAKEWWRPDAPEDLKKALAKTPPAGDLWNKITANAQWEWIRWIRATKQEETRKRRIEVAISKLKSGMRRPCCFNRNLCSEPYVSHNWLLLEPQLSR
jgi:hypothetical protein